MTRDLASVLPRIKVAAALPIDDIIARVRDTANWTGSVPPPLSVGEPSRRQRPAGLRRRGHADPYAGFETRIVPENITLLPKTANQVTGGNAWNERSITVKKGEDIATILQEIGATPDEIAAIATALGPRGRNDGLKEGQKLRILIGDAISPRPRLQPVRVDRDGRQRGRGGRGAVRHGQIRFGRRRQHEHAEVRNSDEDEEDDGKGIRLYQSIYETALRNQIPRPVIDDLIRIYSYDVDFQHKAQPGDSFDVLYSTDEETPNSDSQDRRDCSPR